MKYFKYIFYISFFVILSSACKKEYSVENVGKITPSTFTQRTTIITTGFYWGTGTSLFHQPVYWVDSIMHTLEVPANATNAQANDIEKWNENVIVVGFYHNTTGRDIPCYWINEKRYDLPTNNLTGNSLEAISVKVRDNNLYILGDHNALGYGILWKITNTNISSIIPMPVVNLVSFANIETAYDLCLVGDTLIAFASYPSNSLTPTCISGYWKIDHSDNVSFNIIEQYSTPNLSLYSIIRNGDVNSNNIYAVGYYYSNIASDYITCMWSKQGRITLSKEELWQDYAINHVKINKDGTLYVSLINNLQSKPTIWAISPQGQVNETFINAPNNGLNWQCLDIDINDDDKAILIGSITNGASTTYNFVQKNDKKIPLIAPLIQNRLYIPNRTKIFKNN